MCELLAVSSFQPSRLSFPIKTMTAHSSNDHRLLDGWGVAYYQGKDVTLFREPVAACHSELARCLERQGPAATLTICHLRHATQGEISLANTAPFVRELAGRMHVFAHNGNLKGIEKVERLVPGSYQTIGETDSEYAFCVLLETLKELWRKTDGVPPLIDRMTVIANFGDRIRKLGPANFLYADGDALFAHGDRRFKPETGEVTPPGLYLSICACPADKNIDVGKSAISVNDDYLKAILIASTPLNDAEWRPLAEGELIAIRDATVLESIINSGGS